MTTNFQPQSIVRDPDSKNNADSGVALPSKFQVPDHPSVALLEKVRKEKSQSPSPPPSSLPAPPPYERRDPHEQPSFTSESVAHPVYPILYLPPLISSLPDVPPPPFTLNADESTATTSIADYTSTTTTITSTSTATSSSSSEPQPTSSPQSALAQNLLEEKRQGPHGLPKVLTTETRLPAIDPVSLSLHRALHNFRPLDSNYASTPYADAFNWRELSLPANEEREWYCVAFRSRRKEGSNGDALYEADKKAHEEAVQNGGLLMYWYGVPDPETGLNLATCIWQSKAHAAAANSRPDHIKAMRLARDSYEIYHLERYVLRKKKGTRGVEIDTYESGEVGW